MADVTSDDARDEGNERQEQLLREFSRRLREARENRWPKPKQRDWALAMGLTDVRQYQRWEHGEQLPSMERLPRIVEVSGIDVSDLFEPPAGMTRDGIRTYFDRRMEELENRVMSKMEANFLAIADGQARLFKLLEARLPDDE